MKLLKFVLACTTLALAGYANAGTCTGDLDGDGSVSVPDLIIVLNDWGCARKACPGAVMGDGMTNPNDLLPVLAS